MQRAGRILATALVLAGSAGAVADEGANGAIPVPASDSAVSSVADPPATEGQPGKEGKVPQVPVLAAPPATAPKLQPKLELGGYAKVGFLWQQADPQFDYIGRSNGFRIANARIELTAHPLPQVEAVISLEAAADRAADLLSVSGDKIVAMRDGYVGYRFLPQLIVRAGQLKAPFLAETLQSDSKLIFFDRSIAARGITPPEGFAAEGLSLDRQIGALVTSERIGLGPVGLTYFAGVFDGNGDNRMFNDNRDVMPVGRLEVDFKEMVGIGASAFHNPRTIGDRPNLFQEIDTGWTADLSAHAFGAEVLVAYAERKRERTTADPRPPADYTTGLVAQAAWLYEPWGLEPAYRFSTLSPSSLSEFEKVTWHTIGLNWKPKDGPLRAYASYTMRLEQEARSITNDGFDLGAQVSF